MNRIGPRLGLAMVLIASGIRVAEADITIREHIAVEGSGLMSMASMSGTSTMSISGKRALIQNDMSMHSGFIRMLARGAGQTTEIVRLDDDTIYVLDTRKKRYQRTSIAARRAELHKAMTQATQAQQANPMTFDDSQCDWSEPKLTVGKSGAKMIVGALSAAPVSIVARQSCRDRRSAAVCDIALSFEEWVAGDASGVQEALQFRAAYAEQMGMANQRRDVAERAELLFGRYKQAWAVVADEMRKVEGFPVKTRFALGLGGPGCNGPAGGAPADDPVPASSEAGPSALSGLVVPLTITSQLLSISSESLSANTFEVPAGFKESAR